MIREVRLEDAEAITEIYNYYILETVITFEIEALAPETMRERIREYTKDFPWFVYEEDGRILGYCYAAKWRTRAAYKHSVETTVYLDKNHLGRGLGKALYTVLLEAVKKRGVHAFFAGITLPNEKSQKLHESLGFRKVAHLEEVGRKDERWLDVGYWEYLAK